MALQESKNLPCSLAHHTPHFTLALTRILRTQMYSYTDRQISKLEDPLEQIARRLQCQQPLSLSNAPSERQLAGSTIGSVAY